MKTAIICWPIVPDGDILTSDPGHIVGIEVDQTCSRGKLDHKRIISNEKNVE